MSHKVRQDRGTKNKIDQLLSQLRLLETKQYDSQLLCTKQKLFQFGNIPSRCLANLLNPKAEKSRINTRIAANGERVHTEADKKAEFVNFYSKLYQSSSPSEVDVT